MEQTLFFFLKYNDVPKNKTVTYGRIVVDYRLQKSDPYRTRLTVGGNRIVYNNDVSTPTADLTTCKVLLNSTISTPNARFATIDIKNFYLNTPLDSFKYMQLPISIIPSEIIEAYNLPTSPTMVGYTWRLEKACMVCHKLAYWPTNY